MSKVSEFVKEPELFHTAGGIVKWYNLSVSIKLNLRLLQDTPIPLLGV